MVNSVEKLPRNGHRPVKLLRNYLFVFTVQQQQLLTIAHVQFILNEKK